VSQLQGDLASGCMQRPDHIPKAGQETISIGSQLSRTGLALGTDEGVTADDQSNFSSGQLDHHLNESGGNGAILVRQTLPSRRSYESVGQPHAVDRSAFKQFSHGDRPFGVLAFLLWQRAEPYPFLIGKLPCIKWLAKVSSIFAA
jgi:hypothetical protein